MKYLRYEKIDIRDVALVFFGCLLFSYSRTDANCQCIVSKEFYEMGY